MERKIICVSCESIFDMIARTAVLRNGCGGSVFESVKNKSKSAWVAISRYLYSSLLFSAYISLTIPMVRRSRSRMDSPNWTQRRRNRGVVICRSVGRSFFRLYIRLHVQPPQLNNLGQNLIDGEGVEAVQPLLRGAGNTGVGVLCHDIPLLTQRGRPESIAMQWVRAVRLHDSFLSDTDDRRFRFRCYVQLPPPPFGQIQHRKAVFFPPCQ